MKNDGGFTLIEILVALVIFSIVFLPLTALFVAESKFERSYEHKQTAMAVLKNELEKAKKTYVELPADEEYIVTMAGRDWNVERTVEKRDTAGAAIAVPVVLSTVRIRVARERDTVALADGQVVRETYR